MNLLPFQSRGRGFLPAPANLSARAWSDHVELDWEYQSAITEFDFEVDALPYVHSHSTSGYSDNYDEACPWPGEGAPDVTYHFSTDGGTYDFSLCESSYDTKYISIITTKLTLPVMMTNVATLLVIHTSLCFKISRLQLGITLL